MLIQQILSGILIYSLILTGPLVFTPMSWAQDDFQTRHLFTFKLIDTKKVDFQFFNEVFTNHDAHDFNFYSISPQLKFDFWKNLALGLNYTYVRVKSDRADGSHTEFRVHHRIEPEVNPHWDIGGPDPWLKIQMRNRYEFRWIEDQGSDNPRLRHRTNFEFPLKNAGPVQSVYANYELFYDNNDHRFSERWIVPLGVKFKINNQTSLSLFYMIQSKLSDTWTSSQVLGSHVIINF